jgi:hypothetical protein
MGQLTADAPEARAGRERISREPIESGFAAIIKVVARRQQLLRR